eukprot:m.22668 g.22668  ORF g.22668 m.22668 type:complete len:587 (-) comp7424_c0_seq2:115-1875(-)
MLLRPVLMVLLTQVSLTLSLENEDLIVAFIHGTSSNHTQVWAACMKAGEWADIVVFPGSYFPSCAGVLQEQLEASKLGKVAIASTCESMMILTDATGNHVTSITEGDSLKTNTTVSLSCRQKGPITVGLLLGDELWEPLGARTQMLYGAEVLISSVAADKHSLNVTQNMVVTRGFENAAAVLYTTSTDAMVGNWCNDMIADGCQHGSELLDVTTVPNPGPISISRANFSLADLRLQRSNTIWGDAFRRPYTYQPLCGLNSDEGEGLPATFTQADVSNITVAILQMKTCENNTYCLQKLQAEVRKAAASGADIALTPEMWSTGYNAQYPGYSPSDFQKLGAAFQWTHLSSGMKSEYVTSLQSLAVELDIAIAAGMMRRDEGDIGSASQAGLWPPHNSVLIIDRHGDIKLVYDKVHTCVWSPEESLTTPGRQFSTATINTKHGNVTVGAMICADREFPESARTLGMQGVELILTPNACGLVPAQLRQFATRAAENGAAVAMANYAASACCNGRSVAFDHMGMTVTGPAGPEETMLLAHFDIAALRKHRSSSYGQQLIQVHKNPKICDFQKNNAFQRENAYNRNAGAVV